MTDAGYRTEVLCQWVTAQVNSYIEVTDWEKCQQEPLAVYRHIPKDPRVMWALDVSEDRKYTWLAQAIELDDGRVFTQVVERKHGTLWVPKYIQDELIPHFDTMDICVQSRGCPASEFLDTFKSVESLKDRVRVHALDGGKIGMATGRFRDRVRDRILVHTGQPLVKLAVESGVTKQIAENFAWNRVGSLFDIAGLVAETEAVYGLETVEPEDATSEYEDHDLMSF